MLAVSCTSSPAVAPHAVAPWYKGTLYEGKPFYITKNTISWTSPRNSIDFGHWTATSIHDPAICLTADGPAFTISHGYGWDGVTWGATPPDMLLPTLFHDAMLHARMNGAPIPRNRIDLAFYDIMASQHTRHRNLYYRLVRLFGWCFTFPQHPHTLEIKAKPSNEASH